jgi:hypothetical protein
MEHSFDIREREFKGGEENTQIVNICLSCHELGTVINESNEEVIDDNIKIRGQGASLFDSCDREESEGVLVGGVVSGTGGADGGVGWLESERDEVDDVFGVFEEIECLQDGFAIQKVIGLFQIRLEKMDWFFVVGMMEEWVADVGDSMKD